MYQKQLDALIAYASGERFKEELLKARERYFSGTGEVFEDDKSLELRMASFLDFYVLDWKLSPAGRTAAQLFLEETGPSLPPEELQALQGLTETNHSLWEVRKLGKEQVRLRDLFTGKDTEVFERRQLTGLSRGDILEARLVPCDGHFLFSSAFCFHPDIVRKAILKELKRLRKAQPDFDRREFIWTLSNMRLKFERYRNIAAEQIYAFGDKRG